MTQTSELLLRLERVEMLGDLWSVFTELDAASFNIQTASVSEMTSAATRLEKARVRMRNALIAATVGARKLADATPNTPPPPKGD